MKANARERLIQDLAAMVRDNSLKAVAMSLQVDAANLQKIMTGKRGMPETLMSKIKALIRTGLNA